MSTDEIFNVNYNAEGFLKLCKRMEFLKSERDLHKIKMTFKRNHGQFGYILMQIVDCNVPETYQLLLIWIYHDYMDEFVMLYTDDLLNFSEDTKRQ